MEEELLASLRGTLPRAWLDDQENSGPRLQAQRRACPRTRSPTTQVSNTMPPSDGPRWTGMRACRDHILNTCAVLGGYQNSGVGRVPRTQACLKDQPTHCLKQPNESSLVYCHFAKDGSFLHLPVKTSSYSILCRCT